MELSSLSCMSLWWIICDLCHHWGELEILERKFVGISPNLGGSGLMNFFSLQEEVENLSIEERRLDAQIR